MKFLNFGISIKFLNTIFLLYHFFIMTHLGNTRIVVKLKCDHIFSDMTKRPFNVALSRGIHFMNT